MVKVIGVKFKTAGKVYYFDPDKFNLKIGDSVIVETARGLEFGTVAMEESEVPEEDIVSPLKKIIRIASEEDHRQHIENVKKKERAMQLCQEKVDKHGLVMKLIDVEYTFDNSKIIFYFTADGRVDFRELVKDLAAIYRTRIELRQIGVRDEAKMMGGIGSCGRSLCCHSWLSDFEPVSIKAVAIIVKEPPSSIFLAAPKNRLGFCKALASTPPVKTLPDEGITLLYALASLVIESSKIITSFLYSTKSSILCFLSLYSNSTDKT